VVKSSMVLPTRGYWLILTKMGNQFKTSAVEKRGSKHDRIFTVGFGFEWE
jgi:hypothetical protein